MRRVPHLVAAAAAVLTFVAVPGAASGRLERSAGLRGSIDEGSYRSSAIAGTEHYSIYLPPGYQSSTARYPVIYFLHGLPAAPQAYRSIATVAHAVESSGYKAIVVGVQGARQGDEDPEWLDQGPGQRWETATAVELVSVIDRRYRTIASRRARILIGVSAGGYGAALIAAHHPGTYSVVESWSGYFHPTDPTGSKALDLGSSEANDWANFHKLIPSLKRRLKPYPSQTYFGFYVGTDDTRFRAENEALERELRAARLAHVYFKVYRGAHEWSLWARHAPAWVGWALGHAAPST
jgi:enterochelin esterase-like enzyme